MKLMQKSICALAVLAATATSFTAQAGSVNVTVKGTITPEACTPTLTGGGTVDYGTISPATLSATAYTALAKHDIPLTVTCSTPTQIALKATSSRVGSVAGATSENSVGAANVTNTGLVGNSSMVVGLGMDGASKIGGYSLVLGDLKYDGTAGQLIVSDDARVTWAAAGASNTMVRGGPGGAIPRQISVAASGQVVPVNLTTMTGTLSVQAYINKTSELNLSKNVTLDGLSTIEVVYI